MASPLMFDSDDGESNTLEMSENDDEEETNYTNPRNVVSLREEKVLKGLQTVLTGIPPPPAFTVPQFDSREILKLWRENQKYKVEPTSFDKEKSEKARLIEEEAKTSSWPNILDLNHWDVCYNRSSVSEEIEKLSMKYGERYVGAETSSCINALYAKSPVRTASARKRQRNRAWGHSPGSRLSYLARRRKAFSSQSLQSCSVAGNNNPDKKMIMVEIKKTANRQKKRNSAKKAKPTPNKKTKAEANTYKRALFQSPDQLPTGSTSRTPSTHCVQRSKRNLFAESSSEIVNENGKRERPPERRASPRKRVNRSLSFQEGGNTLSQATSCQPLPSSCAQPTKVKQSLSDLHRQKMLWAVDDALKRQGVKRTKQPDLYQDCMTLLVKGCTKLWLLKIAKGEFQEGTTSENMSLLVKPFTLRAIEELRKLMHLSSAKRRKHMEEIYNDIVKSAENHSNHQQNIKNANNLASSSCEDGRANDSVAEVENTKCKKIAVQKTPVKLFADKIKESPRRSSPRLKNLSNNSLIKPVNVAGPSCLVKTTPVKEQSPRLNKTPKTAKVTPKRIYGDLRVMLSAMKEKADSLQKRKNLEIITGYVSVSEPTPMFKMKTTISPSSENGGSGQKSCSETPTLQDSSTVTLESTSVLKERQQHKRCPIPNESKTCDSTATEVTYRITRRKSQEINSKSNSSKENVDDSDSEILKSSTNSYSGIKRDANNMQDTNKSSPLKSSNFLKILNSPNVLKSKTKHNNLLNSTVASTMFSPEKDEFEIIHKTMTPLLNSPLSRSRSKQTGNETHDLTSNILSSGEVLANSPVVQFKSLFEISSTKPSETKRVLNAVERRNSLLTEETKTEPLNPKTEPLNLPLRQRSLRSTSRDSAKEVSVNSSDDTSDGNVILKFSNSDSKHLGKDTENKENVENQLLRNNFIQRNLDQGIVPFGDDTPKSNITPSDPTNRTLELYRLSNSGGEQVEAETLHPIAVYEKPPVLVPHWELVSISSESSQSPPSLRPHWEQLSQVSETSSGTGTSLPESIMSHWQQMVKMTDRSDKIMFDFEDTSYEINFPSTDDDSRASSICPLIDLPFLIDDSKSGFPSRF